MEHTTGSRAGSTRALWLGEPIAVADAPAFARDLADINARRLRFFGPMMVVVHAAHVAVFWTSAARRPLLSADVLRWRDGLVAAHGIMVPLVALMTLILYRGRPDGLARLMGAGTAVFYLIHGALCTSLDQIVVPSLTAYISYCFGIAVIVCVPPRVSLLAYGAGAATLMLGMTLMQRSSAALLSSLPNCVTLTLVGVVLSYLLYLARRRDFAQRLTIHRQRDELTQLNARLEQRVREQVAEIVARASEVEQLNAQLQVQVRARSSELSRALARLAGQRWTDGTLKRGTVLGERFVIDASLGEGGMGAVYAGIDQSTGRRVAIKIIQATSSRQLDALHRFLREAGAAAAVNHPAVVRMLHVDVSDDGMLFQVQELVEGEVVSRRMGQRWPAADAARLGAVLASALAAAHAKGIVHRDVKPANIMLTGVTPGMKLLDFGIAKLRDEVLGAGERTDAGMIIGTPSFMAPEQVRSDSDVGDRADVYAAGILLFRLLSGELPFAGKTPGEQMTGRLTGAAPDVRGLEPSVPAELARLIAACLATAPADRPAAAALARELSAFADASGGRSLEHIALDVTGPGGAAITAETPEASPGMATTRTALAVEP